MSLLDNVSDIPGLQKAEKRCIFLRHWETVHTGSALTPDLAETNADWLVQINKSLDQILSAIEINKGVLVFKWESDIRSISRANNVVNVIQSRITCLQVHAIPELLPSTKEIQDADERDIPKAYEAIRGFKKKIIPILSWATENYAIVVGHKSTIAPVQGSLNRAISWVFQLNYLNVDHGGIIYVDLDKSWNAINSDNFVSIDFEDFECIRYFLSSPINDLRTLRIAAALFCALSWVRRHWRHRCFRRLTRFKSTGSVLCRTTYLELSKDTRSVDKSPRTPHATWTRCT